MCKMPTCAGQPAPLVGMSAWGSRPPHTVVPADFMSLRGQPIKTAKGGEAHNLSVAFRCNDRSEGLE